MSTSILHSGGHIKRWSHFDLMVVCSIVPPRPFESEADGSNDEEEEEETFETIAARTPTTTTTTISRQPERAPLFKLVHRSPLLSQPASSLPTLLLPSHQPAAPPFREQKAAPSLRTTTTTAVGRRTTPILTKTQKLDEARSDLERSYGTKDAEWSFQKYLSYQILLVAYEKESKGEVGGGGGGELGWRDFTWMDSCARHFSFELCMVTYCTAVYRYGATKNWIKSKGEKVLLNLEDVLYSRIEDAYSLSSAMRSRKDRIKDKSFSYYKRDDAIDSSSFLFTKQEADEAKQHVSVLREIALEFKRIAETMLPPDAAGDGFQFDYDIARKTADVEVDDDVYVVPSSSSDLSNATGGWYTTLTTRAWSSEFVGTCDKVSCLKLYGYCSLLAASLMHMLLSQLYYSTPSVGGADGTLEDVKKSKALLDHILYVQRWSKTLPVRIARWENRLSALSYVYYLRYCFDSWFRRGEKPGAAASTAVFDGYAAQKRMAALLEPLSDYSNVHAAYATRPHYPSCPKARAPFWNDDPWNDAFPSRLEAALRTVDNYCCLVISAPLFSNRRGGLFDYVSTPFDRSVAHMDRFLRYVPFSPDMTAVIDGEIAAIVVPSLPPGLAVLDNLSSSAPSSSSTSIRESAAAAVVKAPGYEVDVTLYKMGLLALSTTGPPVGWTDLVPNLAKLMKDSKSPDVETLYNSIMKLAVEKEMARLGVNNPRRR